MTSVPSWSAQLARYPASTDDQRRFADPMARGMRYQAMLDMMRPLFRDPTDQVKFRAAATFIAEHLRRERDK